MSDPHSIYPDKIVDLLRRFRTKSYNPKSKYHDNYDDTINDTCIYLMGLDYTCGIIENEHGELCDTYPKKIIIPIYELGPEKKIAFESPLSKLVVQSNSLKSDDKSSNCKFQSKLDDHSQKNHCTENHISSKRSLNFDSDEGNDEVDNAIDEGNDEVDNAIDEGNDEVDNAIELKHVSEEQSKVESMDAGACSFDQYSLENSCNISSSVDSDIIHIKDSDEQNLIENLSLTNLKTSPTFNSGNSMEMKELSQSNKRNGQAAGSQEGEKNIKKEELSWLKDYLKEAKLARCWDRFPVPSISCKGKFVCRSATISCFMEITKKNLCSNMGNLEENSQYTHSLDKARRFDIQLLNTLAVSAIMDLMVENKKEKFGLNVSSSEKTDKEKRYHDFNLFSIPYPGCELFTEFTDNNMSSVDVYYDWNRSFNNAPLSIPLDIISSKVCSDWKKYKDWDLRTITENYLKLILRYITDEESVENGLLVHCISGWDRTPLFISLIRLFLWADGHIHTSLNAKQILYFTLAYDWYLFGHKLPERLNTRENILYFCFEFLEVVGRETFMEMSERRERHPSNGSSASGAYDSATEGNETTESSSFGSVTSLASSSSSNPPSVGPSAPSIKVSSLKQTSTTEASLWPFNKENGFTFDGIAENDQSVNLSTPGTGNAVRGKTCTKNSPVRSPLKEHNKGSPKATPSHSGKRGSVRKGTINGVLRELTPGKRSRKNSTSSPCPKEGERSFSESSTDGFVNVSDSETIYNAQHLKAASNPVPVPGRRSRHNSSSSVGSWQLVSAEATPRSFDSPKSCSRTSCNAEMIDSTNTIREEGSLSSSVDSNHSIMVFDRKQRLLKVRKMFFEVEERRKKKEAEDGKKT